MTSNKQFETFSKVILLQQASTFYDELGFTSFRIFTPRWLANYQIKSDNSVLTYMIITDISYGTWSWVVLFVIIVLYC